MAYNGKIKQPNDLKSTERTKVLSKNSIGYKIHLTQYYKIASINMWMKMTVLVMFVNKKCYYSRLSIKKCHHLENGHFVNVFKQDVLQLVTLQYFNPIPLGPPIEVRQANCYYLR